MKNVRFAVVLLVICFMFTIVFSACNPIDPPHTHTFSDAWTFDDNNHWHEATCDDVDGLSSNLQSHKYENDVCTVCGYERHVHTYSDIWSSNEYGHWHETTCGHSVDNFAPHHIVDDICTVCGYTLQNSSGNDHVHTYADEWAHDYDWHWRQATCEHDWIYDIQRHTYTDDVCTVCGYNRVYGDSPVVGAPTDGLEYKLNDDGTGYTVVGLGTATDSVIVVPSIYNSLPVTAIGERAFAYPSFSVDCVVLPNSIISIGAYAFFGCRWDHIVIPSSVTEIAPNAFLSVGLKSIVVEQGNTVYHSDNNCLIETATKTLVRGCANSVIPTDGSVTVIGDSAFDQVLTLKSISIPDTVTTIDNNAFYRCLGLTEIVIPNSVKYIGDGAFSYCSNIKSLSLSNSLIEIGEYAFLYCESIESIVLPESLVSIGMWAFWGCESLQSLFIPKNVTYIGEGIVVNCPNLQSITVDKDNLYFYSQDNCLIDRELQYLLATCNNFTLPDDGSVIYIGRRAFSYNDTLTEFVVSSNIVAIFHIAFSNCTNLAKFVIPTSVLAIGQATFSQCTSLTNIDYLGTVAQWNEIYKDPYWSSGSSLKTITCIDGVITL